MPPTIVPVRWVAEAVAANANFAPDIVPIEDDRYGSLRNFNSYVYNKNIHHNMNLQPDFQMEIIPEEEDEPPQLEIAQEDDSNDEDKEYIASYQEDIELEDDS